MLIKLFINIIIVNLQLFTLNIINIIIKLLIIIICLDTVNIIKIKINVISNNYNLITILEYVIKLKNFLLNTFKTVINII